MAEDVTRFRLSVLRESFQHTRATLALVWSASPRMTLVLAALTLVSAVVPLAVGLAVLRGMALDAARTGALALSAAATGLFALHWHCTDGSASQTLNVLLRRGDS